MNHLFDQHYTSEIFHELCAQYSILPHHTKLIKEDSNLIYDCGDSILRVSHSAIRSARDMEVELDWLDFLDREKVSVVRILPTDGRKNMASVGNQERHFTAVRFNKIAGKRIDKTTWTPLHFQKLGKLTGQIHRSSRAYAQKDQFTYSHWDELIECSYTYLLPEDDRALRQLHDLLVKEFRSYEQNEGNYGMIHNDIHHENYLLTGHENSIVLFDFEVACQSWHLYEIATALYYASLVNGRRNDREFEQAFLHNFLIGYRIEYNLPLIDFSTVLKFMLYRDLFLLGYMAKIWEHKTPPPPVLKYLDLINTSIAVRRRRLGM